MLRICIKIHAKNQFVERDPRGRGPGKLRGLVQNRLWQAIKTGAKPDERGAVRVPLGAGLTAICYPSLGQWVVVTVIHKGRS